MAFREYAREAVFAPLGMTATHARRLCRHTGATASIATLPAFVVELFSPTLIDRDDARSRATAVAFPGLDGVLPGFGYHGTRVTGVSASSCATTSGRIGPGVRTRRRPLGISASPARSCGSIRQRDIALVALTDRPFGEWAKAAWPDCSPTRCSEARRRRAAEPAPLRFDRGPCSEYA